MNRDAKKNGLLWEIQYIIIVISWTVIENFPFDPVKGLHFFY